LKITKGSEWAAYNERFGASGGVSRPKSSANLQVFVLRINSSEPPPDAKPPSRYRQARQHWNK